MLQYKYISNYHGCKTTENQQNGYEKDNVMEMVHFYCFQGKKYHYQPQCDVKI